MNVDSDGKISFDSIKYCETEKDIRRYTLKKGDIIFNNTNSRELVGKTAVWDYDYENYVLSNHMTIIRLLLNSDIQPSYVAKYLHNLWRNRYFEQICTNHINQSSVGLDKLRDISIPLPPLPTQRKIVAVLERAEHLRHLRAEADALTQRLVQSVFLEMFGDPVTNPMGWDVKKLKEISEIVSGVTKGRQFNGKSTVNVPYLRVANVQDGYLELSEIKEIEVLESDVEKYALLEGDVLLTEGGDRDKLGRGAVWHCEISPCIHQNHIFRVRLNRDLILPDYLSMLIGSSHGKKYFLKSAKQTTGIASINSTQLKNLPVYLPPLSLQAHFADIVQRYTILSNMQGHARNEVTSMLDSLMSKAFTGDLIA